MDSLDGQEYTRRTKHRGEQYQIYKAFDTLSSTNSPLMMSILPTLTSALLILGLIGLGVHGLLKK